MKPSIQTQASHVHNEKKYATNIDTQHNSYSDSNFFIHTHLDTLTNVKQKPLDRNELHSIQAHPTTATIAIPNPQQRISSTEQVVKLKHISTATCQFVEHRMPLNDLQSKYNCTAKTGYTDEQVKERMKQQLPTAIPSTTPADTTPFSNTTIASSLITLGTAVVYFISLSRYHEDISNILLPILLVIIAITFNYSGTSNKKLVSSSIPIKALALRNGSHVPIATDSVIEGDILILNPADIVPVDCRVIEITSELPCVADVSLFFPQAKQRTLTVACTNLQNYQLSSNTLLQGMKIVSGSSKVIAVRSSVNSDYSRMKSQSDRDKVSPVTSELKSFVTRSSWIALVFGLAFMFVLYLGIDLPFMASFMYAAAAVIAIQPKGLIGITTISQRLLQAKLKSQQLESFTFNSQCYAMQSIGQVDTLCLDTNALVEDSLSEVTSFWVNRKLVVVNDRSNQVKNQLDVRSQPENLSDSLQICSIFTSGSTDLGGNSVDAALLRYFEVEEGTVKGVGVSSNYEIIRTKHGGEARILFGSNSNQASMSLAAVKLIKEDEEKEANAVTLLLKGRPKQIWEVCTNVDISGVAEPITDQIIDEYKQALAQMRSRGDKVIAMAKIDVQKWNASKHKEQQIFNKHGELKLELNGLTFIGLAALSNVVSSQTRSAVATMHAAGVRMILCSRQSAHAVEGIARSLGITRNKKTVNDGKKDGNAISGKLVNEMLNEKQKAFVFEELLSNKPVLISRADQGTMSSIIEALAVDQSHRIAVMSNRFCESAGASVRIALSDSSNSVQECADVIITASQQNINGIKSQLMSVVEAMEFSRGFEENVKKIFVFVGASQMAVILPVFAMLILRMPLLISPMFMVLLSTVMSIVPAIGLAYEAPEIDTMYENKRSHHKRNGILHFKTVFFTYFFMGCIAAAAGFCAFYTTMNSLGFPVHSLFGMLNVEGYFPSEEKANQMGYDAEIFYDYLKYVVKPSEHFTEAGTVISPSMPDWNSFFMKSKGNCVTQISQFNLNEETLDWLDLSVSQIDLRKVLVTCDATTGAWKTKLDWSFCDPLDSLTRASTGDGYSACYKADALNYAQTAYFLTVVAFQFISVIAVKSLRRSFVVTPFNPIIVISVFMQISLSVLIVEIPEVQKVFRARSIDFWQWGMCAAPFAGAVLVQEELRKIYISFYPWFKKIASI